MLIKRASLVKPGRHPHSLPAPIPGGRFRERAVHGPDLHRPQRRRRLGGTRRGCPVPHLEPVAAGGIRSALPNRNGVGPAPFQQPVTRAPAPHAGFKDHRPVLVHGFPVNTTQPRHVLQIEEHHLSGLRRKGIHVFDAGTLNCPGPAGSPNGDLTLGFAIAVTNTGLPAPSLFNRIGPNRW